MQLDLLDILFSSLDFLIKVVGVLGFILGIYNLYLQRRDKWPRLKIVNAQAILHEFSSGGTPAADPVIENKPAVTLRIQNVGEKDIRLDSAHLCIGNRYRSKSFAFRIDRLELLS